MLNNQATWKGLLQDAHKKKLVHTCWLTKAIGNKYDQNCLLECMLVIDQIPRLIDANHQMSNCLCWIGYNQAHYQQAYYFYGSELLTSVATVLMILLHPFLRYDIDI